MSESGFILRIYLTIVSYHVAYSSHDYVVSFRVFISRLCRFILRIHLTIAVTRILRQRLNSSDSHFYAYLFRMFLTAE